MIRITELEALVCRPDTPVTEALARLTDSERLFQMIVDEDGRLLGTFTDADVRRAILRGVPIDSPASTCMQPEPITGRFGHLEENREKLRTIPGLVAFLPVVDEAGRLREVLLARPAPRDLPALVMAGGAGKRLGPLTAATPKPMLRVGGQPILDNVLERLEEDGINSIFVSVHYLAEQIETFIAGRRNRARIELLHEEEPLGTAGALGRLPKDLDRDVLVVNGDLVTRANFHALETFHERQGHDATITVASYEVTIPYGIVRHGPTGLFESIEEKPRQIHMVAAGIYLLSPEVVALVPRGQPMDMPELLNRARNVGLHIGLFPVHEYWRDVGRPDDLAEAEAEHGDGGRR